MHTLCCCSNRETDQLHYQAQACCHACMHGSLINCAWQKEGWPRICLHLSFHSPSAAHPPSVACLVQGTAAASPGPLMHWPVPPAYSQTSTTCRLLAKTTIASAQGAGLAILHALQPCSDELMTDLTCPSAPGHAASALDNGCSTQQQSSSSHLGDCELLSIALPVDQDYL